MPKHTQVPLELNNLKIQHSLEHGDKIVYAAIRRYMNKDTRECYPALSTIASKLKCSINKVQSALTRLVESGFIKKFNDGHKNHYKFPITEFDKHFESFTDEFLDLDLPLNVKEYYMDIQHFLYDKETGIGRCYMPNAEISRRTGWTTVSVKKYNTILIEKGLLEEEVTDKKDDAGLTIIQKNFNLTGLQQAALWVRAVTDQVTKNTDDIEAMKRELEELKAWKLKKEKEDALNRNSTSDAKFDFD